MADFFSNNLDFITFLYGLSLIILAASCFTKKKMEGDDLPWHLLGVFALIHSSQGLLVLFKPLLTERSYLDVLDSVLSLSSCLFLFEFGRRGIPNFRGKAAGKWIYTPLLTLVMLGWLLAGMGGVIAASRYFLGFPGGILAATALIRVSRKLSGSPGFLLAASGVMIGSYAVVDVLFSPQVPNIGILPLNIKILLQHPLLPDELFKGFLVLAMALAVSLYSLSSVRLDAALDYFSRRSRYVFGISTLAMVLIVIAGWYVIQYFTYRARSEIEAIESNNAEIIRRQFSSEIAIATKDVMALAESPGIVASLRSRGGNSRADALLDSYKWKWQVESCYLLDNRGKVVASSNNHRTGSIVGRNPAQRTDVTMPSIYLWPGHYFAVDLAARDRGCYASLPVQDALGYALGVAVIKKDLAALETHLSRLHGYAFLISPEGIIFLSSHPEMALMSLWPLEKEIIGKLSASRQFGAGPFREFLLREPLSGQQVVLHNKTYLVIRRIIDPEGWSVVLLSPDDQVVLYRLLAILITLALSILIICFFLVMEKSLETAAQVAVSENRFRIVFEAAPGAIFIIDQGTGRLLSANPFMSKWLGYRMEELLSLTIGDIRLTEHEAADECRYRTKDGALASVDETRAEVPYHGQPAQLIIAHDISDRKKAEELLQKLSTLDGLTGIATRRRFDEFLEQEWRRAMRERTTVSLVMCDIDYFKLYNDTYGHLAGDDCLKQVAAAIGEMLHRPGDLAARYGGEEFAMIMADTSLNSAIKLAESVRAVVESLGIPHAGSSANSVVTLSLGVASLIPTQGGSSEELIAAADSALYRAKKDGRNCVRHHQSENKGE